MGSNVVRWKETSALTLCTFVAFVAHCACVASAFTLSRPSSVSCRVDDAFRRRARTSLHDSADGNESTYSSQNDVILTALTSTERWIEDTLSGLGGSEAYARKELSYECETRTGLAEIAASIFRRLREAREMGEEHGRDMEALDSPEKRSTLRLTSVLVIPSSAELSDDFSLFDGLIEGINSARRDARDYVIDAEPGGYAETKGEKWISAVNLSHMHPKFGKGDSVDETAADEDESDALRAYKEQRRRARQSPYPTVMLEVKSSPSQPMMSPPLAGQDAKESPARGRDPEEEGPSVSAKDVMRLEALFGKSASAGVGEAGVEDGVEVDAAAAAVDRFAKSIFSPIGHAQNWVVENDPDYDEERSNFAASHSRHADGAYEFIFSRMASFPSDAASKSDADGKREYIILHNFCTKSATSLEKFQLQLGDLINTIPELNGTLSVSVFHPEHLDKARRSPAPILLLRWGPDGKIESSSNETEGTFE